MALDLSRIRERLQGMLDNEHPPSREVLRERTPASDPIAVATDNVEKEIAALLIDRRTTRIIMLEAAIYRVDKGIYGNCRVRECGDQIDEKRLEAMPATPFCRSCQEKREGKQPRRFRAA